MFSSIVQLVVAAPLAVAALAVAPANVNRAAGLTADNFKEFVAANNITVQAGTYDSSNPISKRDVPWQCGFGVGSYNYYWFSFPEGHSACMGYVYSPNCGSGTWTGQDFEDVQQSISGQLTKDGMFTSTTVGRFTASFNWGTTAFANRDWTYFTLGLLYTGADANIKPDIMYYSRDGDKATTQTYHCP
ncbi:hypothetical protein BR93DRAFT_922670 [Coniochaeta sp. PMI_546]|nr:hypothetical protein BR93DRAFT_922670 [Coniochaeta sp. PMI_546]